EQDKIDKPTEPSQGREQVLNKDAAATPENQAQWRQDHNVSAGETRVVKEAGSEMNKAELDRMRVATARAVTEPEVSPGSGGGRGMARAQAALLAVDVAKMGVEAKIAANDGYIPVYEETYFQDEKGLF